MQEIVVDKCECPFEVSAIIDIVDLIPGATYKYQLKLTNAGNAVFHPASGEFTAKSTIETLNIIVYLRDNPYNHYLISLELVGSHPTKPEANTLAQKLRRQIICVKNTTCATPAQCTPTPTPTPTVSAYNIDKYRKISNYTIESYEDKIYGLYRSDITIADWVNFLNSVAQYEDTYSLWKPQMATDPDCGIQKVYDGFFYIYTVNGCSIGENQCYPNEPTHLSRKISYVSWNDLARYINWLSNGKPKGRQGPDTTEDGSYPLFGNFYSKPIDYYPGSRFWLENGPPPTPSHTPTNTSTPTTTLTSTPTPTITQSPFPVGITITSQPAADLFTAVGIPIVVSVGAVPVPSSVTLLYQWQKSTDGGSSWTDISGAVNALYMITNTQLTDSGTFYRVRLSGSSPPGVNTPTPVNSNSAVLTVQPATITITSQPANFNTSGATATFNVSATIAPSTASLSYIWQKSINSGTTWSNIPGAIISTLSLSNLTVADSGSMYKVIVTGNGGATSITSLPATLVVTAPVIVITQQPTNTISTNASATFSTDASIPGASSYTLTYTWQKSIDSGATWTNVQISNSKSLNVNNITRISNNQQYRVIVSSNTASAPVTSNSATLTVSDDYGGLLVWGSNGNNQLNTTGTFNRPVYTNNTFSIYRSVGVGQNHTLMVNASGILETYGINTQSQTAGGNATKNVVKVATKYNHNLALIGNSISDNRLYSWGANSAGQCGQGTSATVITPTAISLDVNSYQDIATGENHSLAVRSDGVLVVCGNNAFGQLGTGNTTPQTSFVSVGTGYVSVACGQNHSAAIKTDGTLWTWGNNTDGQLGLGDTNQRNYPTQVTGLGFVTKVACGQNFTAVLNSQNQLWIWGANSSNQLGNGLSANLSSPLQVSGNWTDVSAGNIHILAIKSDGTLWAWGGGLQSQIGDGSSITRSAPTQISSISGWENVYAGGTSSCATRSGAIIKITNNPVTTEAQNGTATFDCTATITNFATLSYQWQRSQDGINWNNLTGYTSSTLAISNLNQQISGETPALFDGYYYRCSISGSDNAFNVLTSSAQLIDKRLAVYYAGNSNNTLTLPSVTNVWTQWNDFNYNSTSYGKSATALPIQIIRCYVASTGYNMYILLSDGSIIGQGGSYASPTKIISPSGEKIVKLISNGFCARIYAITENGKLFGMNVGGSWIRIGSTLTTTTNDGGVAQIGWSTYGTYNETLYIISAVDGTLWAWGDDRLMGTGSAAVAATLGTTAPVLVSVDTWSYVGGSHEGFFGIKTDGSIHRLCGAWNGGSLTSNGVLRFTTGTLNLSAGKISPILIDNTTVYTKLAAHSTLLMAYDINNKLHSSFASFNTNILNLPIGWTSISGMSCNYNSYILLMTQDNLVSTAANIALHNGSSAYTWGKGLGNLVPYTTTTGWGYFTAPNAKPRFKSVLPDSIYYEHIGIKGD